MQQLTPAEANNHQNQMDLWDKLHDVLKYKALTAAGLTIGSSAATKVKIANTVTYLHNGVFKSKTTAEVDFTATTHDIAADADTVQERYYVVCLAANGTPAIVAGAQADTGQAKLPELAAVLAAGTPIGWCKLAVAAGATSFDATTDELSEGHITDTYADLGLYMPRFDAEQ